MWTSARAVCINVEMASCATICLDPIVVNAVQAISMTHSGGCVWVCLTSYTTSCRAPERNKLELCLTYFISPLSCLLVSGSFFPFTFLYFLTPLQCCTATFLLCLPTPLLLFVIPQWESCFCFPSFSDGSCSSSHLANHVSCCTGLRSATAAAPSVCDSLCCDFHHNDSTQVFRLSAGSWSPHITLLLTCTQGQTGKHRYTTVQGGKPSNAWLHTHAVSHMGANT